ncbi:TPA: hypothetical protein VJR00_001755 [Streptococcus pyogenes]|nr:hypothetical protein [Streptococcus pyogenes]
MNEDDIHDWVKQSGWSQEDSSKLNLDLLLTKLVDENDQGEYQRHEDDGVVSILDDTLYAFGASHALQWDTLFIVKKIKFQL